jgi:ABC-type multidrug transport system fused ATPase/permease subunit
MLHSGTSLSAGEVQLLVLARVLLENSKVLILDEGNYAVN